MKIKCDLNRNRLTRVYHRKSATKKSAVVRTICGNVRGGIIKSDEGSQLVEFALILPTFFVLLIGVFSFGLVYYNQLTLTQAVGAGSRYLQINRANSTDPCANTLAVIQNSAPSLNPSNISLTLNINGSTVSGNSCSSYASTLQDAQNAPVVVSATYPCNFQALSSAVSMINAKFASTCHLSAQVSEYEY